MVLKKTCIGCSIFARELEELIRTGELSGEFKYYDSMLHMRPDKLYEVLGQMIDSRSNNTDLVVMGECFSNVDEYLHSNGIVRTSGINCIEITLGSQIYRKLRREGAFFLMPEWTLRFEEAFVGGLGFNKQTCQTFMKEMHSRIIYIDTGVYYIPYDQLARIKDFTGLDVEILSVGLEHILDSINKTKGD